MTDQPVYLETKGEIATLVLNRPDKHNALNEEIWRTIPALAAEVAGNSAIKVLILRGAGPEAFAAGADISEFAAVHATPERARDYHASIAAAYEAVAGLVKPTIAMVRGVCYGGGCALALTCDMRYADRTARFAIPPARLGLAYSLRETKRLADLVGPSKAKEMLMGAKALDAEEALQAGLATRLFDAPDLERETLAFAEELCSLSQYTIRAVKQTVGIIAAGATDDTEETRALSMGAFDKPDYHEGRDAFLEQRQPKFTYR